MKKASSGHPSPFSNSKTGDCMTSKKVVSIASAVLLVASSLSLLAVPFPQQRQRVPHRIPVRIFRPPTRTTQEICKGCNVNPEIGSKLDPVLVNNTIRSISTLSIRLQNRTFTYKDMRNAANNVWLLKAHFHDLGLTAALDSAVQASKSAAVTHVSSIEQAQALQKHLESQGIPVTVSQVMELMMQSPQQREDAFATLDKFGGVDGIFRTLIRQFHTLEDQLTPQGSEDDFWTTIDPGSYRCTIHRVQRAPNPFSCFGSLDLTEPCGGSNPFNDPFDNFMANPVPSEPGFSPTPPGFFTAPFDDGGPDAERVCVLNVAAVKPGTKNCDAFKDAAAVFGVLCYLGVIEACPLAAICTILELICDHTV
jgi:hypothetical protein